MEDNKQFKLINDEEIKIVAGGRSINGGGDYLCPDCFKPLEYQGGNIYKCPNTGDRYKLVKDKDGNEDLVKM